MYKNGEGYTDFTAFSAIKAVDGAETKAYHTIKTIQSVARLAGFKVSDFILTDRTGTRHKASDILKRRQTPSIFEEDGK